jgi:hypothetical protein
MMRRRNPPTVNELISMLRHSSVPAIFVEGPDDMMVYRWLKQHIQPLKASPIECGGRNNLLSIYEQRDKFSHLKTVFLADKDLYVFLGVPKEYSEVIWTTGYSIENDIYAGSTKLDDLLDEEELQDYKKLIGKITEWFAFEIEKHKNGNASYSKIDVKILYDDKQPVSENEAYIRMNHSNNNTCVNVNNTCVNVNLVFGKNFIPANQNLVSEIKNNFKLKLRGKIIFKVLSVYLSDRKRDVKHKKEALYEIGTKPVDKHRYMKRLILKINQKLGNIKPD